LRGNHTGYPVLTGFHLGGAFKSRRRESDIGRIEKNKQNLAI